MTFFYKSVLLKADIQIDEKKKKTPPALIVLDDGEFGFDFFEGGGGDGCEFFCKRILI